MVELSLLVVDVVALVEGDAWLGRWSMRDVFRKGKFSILRKRAKLVINEKWLQKRWSCADLLAASS